MLTIIFCATSFPAQILNRKFELLAMDNFILNATNISLFTRWFMFVIYFFWFLLFYIFNPIFYFRFMVFSSLFFAQIYNDIILAVRRVDVDDLDQIKSYLVPGLFLFLEIHLQCFLWFKVKEIITKSHQTVTKCSTSKVLIFSRTIPTWKPLPK